MQRTVSAVILETSGELAFRRIRLPDSEDRFRIIDACSVCESDRKLFKQNTGHKRRAAAPFIQTHYERETGESREGIILGHEFGFKDSTGQCFAFNPALATTMEAAGYSWSEFGGFATAGNLPLIYQKEGNVFPVSPLAIYESCLIEPYACAQRAIKFQTHRDGTDNPMAGFATDPVVAVLGGTGPMGIATIDEMINDSLPRGATLVVTGREMDKIKHLERAFTPMAQARGIKLEFVQVFDDQQSAIGELRAKTEGQKGFSDILVFTTSEKFIPLAVAISRPGACIQIFAGFPKGKFADLDLYAAHYETLTLLGGFSGPLNYNMSGAIDSVLTNRKMHPELLISHIASLESVPAIVQDGSVVKGAKTLVYNYADLSCLPGGFFSLDQLPSLSKQFPQQFSAVAEAVHAHEGRWSVEAEKAFLKHVPLRM